MDKGKALLLSILIMLILTLNLGGTERLLFQWAFLYKLKDSSTVKSFDISSPELTLYEGSRIKLMVEPLSSVYIHIFSLDSAGTLRPLFPYSFNVFEDPFYTQNRFFIPGGKSWFSLPASPGIEKFIIIASLMRERDIEKKTLLLAKYYGKNMKKYTKTSEQLLEDIAVLVKRSSRLTSSPEKPVSMAGRVRGDLDVDEEDCFLVESEGFYVKTIKVKH